MQLAKLSSRQYRPLGANGITARQSTRKPGPQLPARPWVGLRSKASDGPTLQDHFSQKMQAQLDAIESIREDLNSEGISVPGVVVVGAQSSGKSSVLESLSGIQLPRGDTITTRVPLLLRLEDNSSLPEGDYKAFISKKASMEDAEEVPFDQIAHKVREYTVELAGEGGGVKDAPIHLKIQRRGSPNLTLIDLPGIAYNTADTSISEDIAKLTKDLIKKYIESSEMIIVVVLPAADDFASHESIKMAREHDKQGTRTLGVVTKTDRLETGKGFAAKMRAAGEGHIKLQLGYVALKNRNQEEVDSGMSLADARSREQEFFLNDARVKDLDSELWGMDTVIDRIIEIQSHKLSECIPKMRDQVKEKIRELEEAIDKLPPIFSSAEERHAYYTDLVQKLVTQFKDLATTRDIPSIKEEHLAVASKTSKLYDDFSSGLKESIPDFLDDEYQTKLEDMLQLSKGGSLPNFLSHPVFALCVQEDFVQPLTRQSTDLVDATHDYILDTFRSLLLKGRECAFPEMAAAGMPLRQAMLQETMDFLHARKVECQANLHIRSKAEEFIHTLDDMYGKTIEELKSAVQDQDQWGFTWITAEFAKIFQDGNNNTKALCELQASLKAYVQTRSRCADDDVAKINRYFFVRLPMDNLARYLYSKIPEDRLADLMAEDKSVARKRTSLSDRLEMFKRIRKVLQRMT